MEVIGSRHIVMWKSLTSIRGPYAGLRRISLDHQLFPWLRNTSCPSFLGSSISRMRRKVEFCATWILDHSFVSATNGVSCFVHDLSSYSFVRFNCAYLCAWSCAAHCISLFGQEIRHTQRTPRPNSDADSNAQHGMRQRSLL